MTETSTTRNGYRAASAALFMSMFAAQAALIAMSPVLAVAAGDLHVSTADAGQLRTIAGLAAGITALLLGRVRLSEVERTVLGSSPTPILRHRFQ